MEAKHTPGPLMVADTNDFGDRYIANADKSRVAICCRDPLLPVQTDPVEANAEFIVRACNSYYDMLAALKGLLEHIDKGDLVRNIAGETLPLVLTIKNAQVAIAKAEGK